MRKMFLVVAASLIATIALASGQQTRIGKPTPLAHFTASHYLQRRLHRLPGQDVTASGRAAHHQQNELVKE
jgi:hypothetical protein